MKLLKWLPMLAIVATTVFATSCKKENTQTKPDGFGIQGYWTTGGNGGMAFMFDALPSRQYKHVSGSLRVFGQYTYIPNTDKLTLQANADGSPVETYNIVWKDDKYKSFTLVATGTTPKTKEGTYTFSIES